MQEAGCNVTFFLEKPCAASRRGQLAAALPDGTACRLLPQRLAGAPVLRGASASVLPAAFPPPVHRPRRLLQVVNEEWYRGTYRSPDSLLGELPQASV